MTRDPATRRRGRRQRRSEIPKAPALPAGMGSLFINSGLIGNMDLVSLPNLHNVPNIPISGLMGFPPSFAPALSGEDAKNSLCISPMVLHSMPAIQPPVNGTLISGIMNPASSTASPTISTATSSSRIATVTSTSFSTLAASHSQAYSSSNMAFKQLDSPVSSTESQSTDERAQREDDKKMLAVAANPSFNSSNAKITSTGGHLAFNPFLIPGMPHGLLYPHMFLPHGSIMALPVSTADGIGSPKRKRKNAMDDDGVDESKLFLKEDEINRKGSREEEKLKCKHKDGRLKEILPAVEFGEHNTYGSSAVDEIDKKLRLRKQKR